MAYLRISGVSVIPDAVHDIYGYEGAFLVSTMEILVSVLIISKLFD